tara:strand:+ start:161 stop:829 length:669 start_codon:yes stop_codon:yes gene_type:complete
MADIKEYAYFRKGDRFAIMEVDTTTLPNTTFPGDSLWKSPQSSIVDGIEIEYSFSGKYFIDETDKINTAIDTYLSLDGLLKFIDSASDNYSASPESLSDGSYIVLRKAGRWNGLHKVKDAGIGYITTYTKFSGSATVEKAFERAPDLYYNVDVLNDEADEIPVSEHLAKAVVYYVKAKLAEDAGQIDLKEYNMKEFYRLAHKSKKSREYGPTMVIPGSHAIR